MSYKSKMIEMIEEAICCTICDLRECKSSCGVVNCNQCLKEYAQLIVDNNLNKETKL